jgi:hypothetical protein
MSVGLSNLKAQKTKIHKESLMKKRTYKMGKFTCRTYFKPAGSGWEVGAYFGPKKVFTGNFIHKPEATHYWAALNKDMKTFCGKYWVAPTAPFTWYQNFMTTYMYKNYYSWLDTQFTKYQREHTVAFKKHEHRYQQMKKQWTPAERVPFKMAA